MEIEKFNPYHDSLGRFSSANSATLFTYKPGKGKMYDKAIAKECARTLVADATEREKVLTKALQGCAKEVGGEMVGLEFAVKGVGSLSRKIYTEAQEKNISAAKASENMKDVNRYTIRLTEDNFVAGYQKTMQRLESQGYEVARVKNTLANPNAEYRGVNTNIRNPDGSIWELQFHTKASLEIKDVNHLLYEKQRLDSTPPKERAAIGKQMADNAASIPTPKGIEQIKNVNRL